MKIVYCSSALIPSRAANSIQIMKMCGAFAANGRQVLLLAPALPDCEKISGSIYEFYGVEPSFKIAKLPWFGIKGKTYIYGFLCALQARLFGADIVYGRFLQGCLVSAMMGLPVVYESHLPLEGEKNKWIFRRLLKHKNLKQIVVISEVLKNYYQEEYGIADNLIAVAHDGADEPKDISKIKVSNLRRMQAGYIGSLYAGKGMEIIIDLAKQCDWADFHIVGGFDVDIVHWKDITKNLCNIFFHGFLPPPQTDIYRQSFDVLLAPYQKKVSSHAGRGKLSGQGDISQWMSPMKVFEYMAAKKAIIASDLPVLREVLNETNSILVGPEDINGWVEALRKLQDKTLREKLANKTYEDFINNYTWQKRAESVLSRL